MMSKKQWLVLLCLLIAYLLLGACFFYEIETREELRRRELERVERREIEELLHKHYVPSFYATQDEIFKKLSTYCGKPMTADTADDLPYQWDFYHCLFFVFTVASTLGYGNLAPTTMMGRIFMIFYGLIGIPISGIIMLTLGDFFGKSFRQLYSRWKTQNMNEDAAKLSLIAQIILYLVPGFTFFIFIPSVIIWYFEGWDYDIAVYYAFVTLTTIGFGDYVAGVNNKKFDQFGTIYVTLYKIFLLVWIVIGLGYVVMVIGFITRGMRSKKMHEIEHKLAINLKRTPHKIRALKALIHEIILLRTKPVYKKHSIFLPKPNLDQRRKSCPDLSMYFQKNESPTMKRKRALSETTCCEHKELQLQRVQSDTDLSRIDRELTFNQDSQESTDFLFRVANILDDWHGSSVELNENEGVHGFCDTDILESEKYSSQWTIGSSASQLPIKKRVRTKSEAVFPFKESVYESNVTWCGQDSTQIQEMREKAKYGRCRSRTLPVQQEPLVPPPPSFFKRIKNIISKDDDKKNIDVEKQPIKSPCPLRHRAFSESQEYIKATCQGRQSVRSLQPGYDFEKTIAELILALTTETLPQRKLGTACLTPPNDSSASRVRRIPIRPAHLTRRSSMIPTTPIHNTRRRLSFIPARLDDNLLTPPPPYSAPIQSFARRFSLRPVTSITSSPSPVQRQVMRNLKDTIREGEPKL